MKIDVTEKKTEKRCYTYEKKKNLKRNYEKTREEICIIEKIKWKDLTDNWFENDRFESHVENSNDFETQDNDEKSREIKFAELKSRFSWTFLKDVRSLLTTIKINIFKMKLTTLITTNENSC